MAISSGRILTLDALRGVAVFFMVEVHFGFWWLATFDKTNPIIIAGTLLGGVAAPLFLVIVGASLVLSVNRRRSRGQQESEIAQHVLLRGLLILGFGFVLNVLTLPIYGLLGWGVLHIIGASILIAYFLLRFPPLVCLVVAGLVIALSPLLRLLLGFPTAFAFEDLQMVRSPADFA